MPDFADDADILVRAGDGGSGACTFRHEKFVPFGGPDGGDGGRGGDVVLRGTGSMVELSPLNQRRRFAAQHGSVGKGARKHGKRGADLIVNVPLGTMVWGQDQLLGDITQHGQVLPVARGGRGGLGNVHFATATRRAPRFAQKGEPGEERLLHLDLKVLGNVGIVGAPNVGKSSLLAAMTAAHPEVAAYPFTTLVPNLGVAEVGELRFVAVDIPGLIPGAHAGVGLGFRFLRHVQRAPLLVHVVDLSDEDPLEGYQLVRRELGLFDAQLLDKPCLVALNKIDLAEGRSHGMQMRERLGRQGIRAYLVSALTGEGVAELTVAMSDMVSVLSAQHDAEPAVRTYRLAEEEEGFEVAREGEAFRVRGRRVERAVAMADMDSDEGLADLQRRLDRLGVFRALEEAGVRAGDPVRIADFELEWT